MKRILLITPLLFILSSLFCQESNQNYTTTRIMLDGSGTKYLDNIQYYDGLGRPFMNVQKGITPGKANLITLQEYDGFGRGSKSWLPHVSTSAYVDPGSLKSAVPSTYNGDGRPYTETVYENSPLSRVLEQRGPGASWVGHSVSTSYMTNDDSKELSCNYYSVTSFGALAFTGKYKAGQLYVVKTTDEDGNVSYVFTDQLGRKILTRQMLVSDPHDTYYVYDDFGNLRFVLPPAHQDTPSLALYAYQYRYDVYGRCVEKKIPGCEAIKYVYDKADNLIFSQDGVQRSKGEWTFYLYDAFHRPVLKGTCKNTNTSSVKDLYVKTQISRNTSTRMILQAGIDYSGYSSSFEIVSPTIHKVNYYDDYTFLGIEGFSGKAGGSVNAKGLLTGSITYLLGDGLKYCTVTHYDQKGRVVKTISDNAMRGTETVTTAYTFTGMLLNVKKVHTASLQTTHTETYTYDYDHAERLLRVFHQLDSGPLVTLSQNDYDDLGRLRTKTFHGNSDLKNSYSYNIRNWLTGISSNSFKQSLYYNTGPATLCYNGNISRIECGSGIIKQGYNYSYDNLNRLLSADFFSTATSSLNATPNYSEKVLEYDKHGNIRRFQRYGISQTGLMIRYGLLDNLTMSYNGNQLKNITDACVTLPDNDRFNYLDSNKDLSLEFEYDDNGNLTKDLDKQITSISYNSLNLPDSIVFNNNNYAKAIVYTYDADGTKRRVTHITPPAFTLQPMASLPGQGGITIGGQIKRYLNTTTYCNNLIYQSTSTDNGFIMSMGKTNLERILTEEGYITFNGTTPVYHYFVKDHLGNVRVVMNQDGKTVEQSNDYYPFGGIVSSKGDDEQPYKFCGKELDQMHGLNWYDSGARYLRNDAPGWMGIDPLCEKYYSISPYAYCNNNPVRYVDPNGMDWYQAGASAIWKESSEPTITIGGVVYDNVGTNYAIPHKNLIYTYSQNNLSSITYVGIESDNFISQSGAVGCKVACDEMLASEGVNSKGERINIVDADKNGVATTANKNANNGIDAIDQALEAGNPIEVGVDYKTVQVNNLKSDGGDGMTDHFVVISSKTEQIKNGKTVSTIYNFFDPRTGNKTRGTSSTNILQINNKMLNGSFMKGDRALEKRYTVTTVRRSR